jgi:hypothetical protein
LRKKTEHEPMVGAVFGLQVLPLGYLYYLPGARLSNPHPLNHMIPTASPQHRKMKSWARSKALRLASQHMCATRKTPQAETWILWFQWPPHPTERWTVGEENIWKHWNPQAECLGHSVLHCQRRTQCSVCYLHSSMHLGSTQAWTLVAPGNTISEANRARGNLPSS